MTTSDDEPMFADDADMAGTTHAEPLDGLDAEDGGPAEPAQPAARWLLGVLAGLGVAVLGVLLWAAIFYQFEREYVGVSVVIGLTVGWVVRVVSRRATFAARAISVVITAASLPVGTALAWGVFEAKDISSQLRMKFWDHWNGPRWEQLGDVEPVTWAIFAAALVLAYLSAGPQKEKTPKGAPAPVAESPAPDEAPMTEPFADEPAEDK